MIVALRGLRGRVVRGVTLSSDPRCPSLATLKYQASPIMRVAVEPENPSELPQLQRGLRLLGQADPSVQVALADSGEYVIVALGELHLEHCLRCLRDDFAKIEVRASPPIISFRETITQRGVPFSAATADR